MASAVRFLLVLAAVSAASGCRDLDRFDTGGSAAYCGEIVRAQFVRTREAEGGFDRPLELALEIDADALSTEPGTLSSNDAEGGCCAPDATFANAPLTTVPEVLHDTLSTLIFDDSQQQNLVTWVESTCRGPMLAIVSLLKSGDVEVRLLTPPPTPSDAAGAACGVEGERRAAFAIFQLKRREAGCGF